jgi:hypothetical protein
MSLIEEARTGCHKLQEVPLARLCLDSQCTLFKQRLVPESPLSRIEFATIEGFERAEVAFSSIVTKPPSPLRIYVCTGSKQLFENI